MAYTNPSFCQQSEFVQNHRLEELPPPPQFQAAEELPPPSPSPPPPPPGAQPHQQRFYDAGKSNPGFRYAADDDAPTRGDDRYAYLERKNVVAAAASFQDAYAVPINERRPIVHEREVRSRYEYIQDDDEDPVDEKTHQNRPRTPEQLTRNSSRSSRYGFLESPDNVPAVFAYQRRDSTRKTEVSRYALLPANSLDDHPREPNQWNSPVRNSGVLASQRSNSNRGRYARVPSQEVLDPPVVPERNAREQQLATRHPEEMNYSSGKNNVATQKLHEILTTPRKPRSRSEERTLSPSKRHQQYAGVSSNVVQRGAMTPTGSPSGRYVSSPSSGFVSGSLSSRREQRQLIHGSSQRGIDSSPSSSGTLMGPHTSTPTKEPSARRCLPLNVDNSSSTRVRDIRESASCPASNCGRQRYPSRNNSVVGSPSEPPPRYAYLDGLSEAIPMVTGSPRYQVVPTSDEKSIESAFIARTAVVPPLSPPNSEANTTLASGIEKSERRNAPLLLLLVGVLTCGLALYLSWSQGRRYYLDSAAGCGACCALAGACRSLRRTWTGLGLAGLSALSCGGLLLLAAKAPRAGTPLHDVTAGALCGVSLLGAALALLALLSPKCHFSRHRRVHSWIPRFSP
ncbi:uncharacterized protein spdo [Venturia canescens]|uniref:uncharacterized protein spdo n=1 Tax=Venturia canescens TaxID=32260 RepID=UPI001C9D003B|nr:uncharacterized protein LOC122417855 [Venturia canescens]XP_043287635.1 uncharacterized protein LOC122417855 [Venturia canescens]